MKLYMIISIVGLVFDIVGVGLLFSYGILPHKIFDNLLWDGAMDTKDIKSHHRGSKIGLWCLIIGFVFQIIGLITSCAY